MGGSFKVAIHLTPQSILVPHLTNSYCMEQMRKRNAGYMHKLSDERGFVGFVVAAVALPVLVIICVGMFDLIREPLARNAIQSVTKLFAKQLEQGLDASATTGLVDSHMPAGNNLFGMFSVSPTPSGASASSITRSGIINATSAADLISVACGIASTKMEEAFTSFVTNKSGAHNYAFQIGLVKLTYGDTPAVVTLATSDDSEICAGMKFDDSSQGDVVSQVATNLQSYMATAGGGQGRGGWYVDDGSGISATRFLDSYWLVVVGYVKIEPYFRFVFGDTREIVSAAVLDLGTPAGFESSSAFLPSEGG